MRSNWTSKNASARRRRAGSEPGASGLVIVRDVFRILGERRAAPPRRRRASCGSLPSARRVEPLPAGAATTTRSARPSAPPNFALIRSVAFCVSEPGILKSLISLPWNAAFSPISKTKTPIQPRPRATDGARTRAPVARGRPNGRSALPRGAAHRCLDVQRFRSRKSPCSQLSAARRRWPRRRPFAPERRSGACSFPAWRPSRAAPSPDPGSPSSAGSMVGTIRHDTEYGQFLQRPAAGPLPRPRSARPSTYRPPPGSRSSPGTRSRR